MPVRNLVESVISGKSDHVLHHVMPEMAQKFMASQVFLTNNVWSVKIALDSIGLVQ